MRTILIAFFLAVFFFAGLHFGFVLAVSQQRDFVWCKLVDLNVEWQIQKNMQAKWQDTDFLENYRKTMLVEGKLQLIEEFKEYQPNLNEAFFSFFKKEE